MLDGSLAISGSTFQFNSAQKNGGALFFDSAGASISTTTFYNNRALMPSGSDGGGGAIGILTPVASPAPATTNNATTLGNLFSHGRERRNNSIAPGMSAASTQNQDEDDLGIFAELYSENPDPVNPSGPETLQREASSRNSGTEGRAFSSSRRDPSDSERSFTSSNHTSRRLPRLRMESASTSNQGGTSRNQEADGRGSSRRGSVFSRLFRRAPPDA